MKAEIVFNRIAFIAAFITILIVLFMVLLFTLPSCVHKAPSPGPYPPCWKACVDANLACQIENDLVLCDRDFELCMSECDD